MNRIYTYFLYRPYELFWIYSRLRKMMSSVAIRGSQNFSLFFSESKLTLDLWPKTFFQKFSFTCIFFQKFIFFSIFKFEARVSKFMWDDAHSLYFNVWKAFYQTLPILGKKAKIDYNEVKLVECVFFLLFWLYHIVNGTFWKFMSVYRPFMAFIYI